MTNSLKEITNRIADFCDRHEAVNEFQANDFSLYTSADHSYPLVWATPTSVAFVPGQATNAIQVSIMDNVYDHNDLIKVLSDLEDTLAELLSWIDDDSGTCNYYADINTSFQPFFRSIDSVCGWQGTINFRGSWQADIGTIRFKD